MAKHGSPGQLALFESPKASRRRRYRPTYDHYSVEAIRRTNDAHASNRRDAGGASKGAAPLVGARRALPHARLDSQ